MKLEKESLALDTGGRMLGMQLRGVCDAGDGTEVTVMVKGF